MLDKTFIGSKKWQIIITLILVFSVVYIFYSNRGRMRSTTDQPVTSNDVQQLQVGEHNISLKRLDKYFFPNGEELSLRVNSSAPEFYPNKEENPNVFTPIQKKHRFYSEELIYEFVNNGCSVEMTKEYETVGVVECAMNVNIYKS